MTSLIIIRRGGDVVGQCDALCYDAKHPDCVCTGCGGVNHGQGLEVAIANTRRLAAQWRDRARQQSPAVDVELDDAVQNLTLFPLP